MHQDFSTFNPLRAADWRSQRVEQLLAAPYGPHGPLLPTFDDQKEVRRYFKFRCSYQVALRRAQAAVAGTSRDPLDHSILVKFFFDWADLWYAQQIHNDLDSLGRAIVQARLLARESDKQIASRLGTLPKAIESYEKIFFHVRDRFHCNDWIVKTILGSSALRTSSLEGSPIEAQREAVLKLFGYYGRSHALNVALTGFMPVALPASAEEAPKWFAHTYNRMLLVQATAALQPLRPNSFQVMQLLELGEKSAAVADRAGGDRTDLERAVEETLNSIPWELGVRREGRRTALEQEVSASPYEPRAAEELMIGAGYEPPELMELIRGSRPSRPQPPDSPAIHLAKLCTVPAQAWPIIRHRAAITKGGLQLPGRLCDFSPGVFSGHCHRDVPTGVEVGDTLQSHYCGSRSGHRGPAVEPSRVGGRVERKQ